MRFGSDVIFCQYGIPFPLGHSLNQIIGITTEYRGKMGLMSRIASRRHDNPHPGCGRLPCQDSDRSQSRFPGPFSPLYSTQLRIQVRVLPSIPGIAARAAPPPRPGFVRTRQHPRPEQVRHKAWACNPVPCPAESKASPWFPGSPNGQYPRCRADSRTSIVHRSPHARL